MSVHLPTHFGFERLADDQYALTTAFFRALSKIRLQNFIVGLVVMAAVTLTERALDAAKTDFAFEWIILSAVALVTFGLLGQVVARGTTAARVWIASTLVKMRRVQDEQKLSRLVANDHRMMSDIRAARDRQEWNV